MIMPIILQIWATNKENTHLLPSVLSVGSFFVPINRNFNNFLLTIVQDGNLRYNTITIKWKVERRRRL